MFSNIIYVGELKHLLRDCACYFFTVATTVEVLHRLQNAFTRFANCRRRLGLFACFRAEVEIFKHERLTIPNFSGVSLPRTLGFGLFVQPLIFIFIQPRQPTFTSVVVLSLLTSISWCFRTPRHGMGFGLAWSYYFAYLKITLQKRFDEPLTYHDNDIVGLFLLVPKDYRVFDDIPAQDRRVTYLDDSEPITKNVGGVRHRKYDHSVYKIEGKRGQELFAFVEYVTPISHFLTMARDPHASLITFTDEEMKYQFEVFSATLETILQQYAPADIPYPRDRKVDDFVQIIYTEGEGKRDIAAKIGEKAWNMTGHAGQRQPARSQRGNPQEHEL